MAVALKNEQAKLIKLEPLSELITATVWTGWLSDEDPVSAVLVAPQESAKTEMLKMFRGTKTLEFFSDVTAKGLFAYRKQIEEGKLRHIVILDLVRMMAHPKVTTQRTLQAIASLIEEGSMQVADAGGVEWRGEDVMAKLPRIGALMAVTPAIYFRQRKMFRDTGFMSRFLPIHYSYKPETAKAVHTAIRGGNIKPAPSPVVFPKEKMKAIIPDSIARLIENDASELGMSESTWGFRWHRAMRTLMKARAVSKGRFKVDQTDYLKLAEWRSFFRGTVEL